MHNLVDTWNIHQRMNEYLIRNINEENFPDKSAAGGRTVGEQLAHLHNVRLMWLKVAAPGLFDSQVKIEKENIRKDQLLAEMKKSGTAIAQLIEEGLASGRIKGFKPHPEAFTGYLISHEAHHKGQVILILKENKHMPDKKILYGIWEWGTK